jgi:hypothetical protein
VLFDDTARHGAEDDLWLSSFADEIRDHLLAKPEPLSEKLWRLAGYRFARALAQGRPSGIACVREFAEGMRAYCTENVSLGGPILYDVKRADSVEEKAEKLLALATHKNTGDAEARAAMMGLLKLYASKELAVIASERLGALGRTLTRLTESINFIRREHPTLFLWSPDDKNPSPIDR